MLKFVGCVGRLLLLISALPEHHPARHCGFRRLSATCSAPQLRLRRRPQSLLSQERNPSPHADASSAPAVPCGFGTSLCPSGLSAAICLMRFLVISSRGCLRLPSACPSWRTPCSRLRDCRPLSGLSSADSCSCRARKNFGSRVFASAESIFKAPNASPEHACTRSIRRGLLRARVPKP